MFNFKPDFITALIVPLGTLYEYLLPIGTITKMMPRVVGNEVLNVRGGGS